MRKWVLMMAAAVAWCVGAAPVKVIFDTDIGPDYDDVGAMAVLHTLADRGEVEILATVSCNMTPLSVPCIEILNDFYGRSFLPVGSVLKDGANLNDGWHKEKWPEVLVAKYKRFRHKTSLEAPSAVRVYRRALADAQDGSVTVVTVGFFTNLAQLMKSGADEISPLDGMTLIQKKVKRLVSMAGGFPKGREFNVYTDAKASKVVFEKWPTPILFSGVEIGNQILTGKRLITLPCKRNPVKDAFATAMKTQDMNGRASWDETAVLVAIRGSGAYFGEERGTISVDEKGANGWTPSPTGPHARLLPKMPAAEVVRVIEDLMMTPPAQCGCAKCGTACCRK